MALIKCPQCGETVSDKANSCPHCGVELGQCPECGGIIKYGVCQCPLCGVDLKWGTQQQTINSEHQEKEKAWDERHPSLSSCLVLIVIGAIISFCVHTYGGDDKDSSPNKDDTNKTEIEQATETMMEVKESFSSSNTEQIESQQNDEAELENNKTSKQNLAPSFYDTGDVIIFLCSHEFKAENGNVVTFEDEGNTVCFNGRPLSSIQNIRLRNNRNCFIDISGAYGQTHFILNSELEVAYIVDVNDMQVIYYAE